MKYYLYAGHRLVYSFKDWNTARESLDYMRVNPQYDSPCVITTKKIW